VIFATKKIIEQFYIDHVQPQHPAVKTFFDNVTGQPNGAIATPWVRHTILETERSFLAVGMRQTRVTGTIALQIFQPAGIGSQLAMDVVETIEREYTGVCASGVQFGTVTVNNALVVGDWYQLTVYVAYYADE
jgi:hypothetical protein